jgi:hypothetical protein
MGKRVVIAAVVCSGVLGADRAAFGEETKMGALIKYPHAGIALAVPEGYYQQAPRHHSEILRAAQVEKNVPVRSIVLLARPVRDTETAEMVVDGIATELRKNLAFRHLRERTISEKMAVAETKGVSRLLSYTFQGHKYVAGLVCFVREIESPKIRIGYILNVEVSTSYLSDLVKILDAVAKSVKLIELRQAAKLPVEQLGPRVTFPQYGFTIQAPHGWFAMPTREGLLMGLGDFVFNQPIPVLYIIVQDKLPLLTTAREYARKALEQDRQEAEKRKMIMEGVSEGPAKLGGLEGYQLILYHGPAEQQEEQKNPPVTVVFRVVCQPSEKDQTSRSYFTRLVYFGKDAEAADAMLEKIVGSFEFVAPDAAPTPTTTPATSPSKKKE